MTKKGPEAIPSEKKERLVNIFYPKRASFIFYYVFGVVVFIAGLGFNVASAANFIIYDLLAWTLGLAAMIFGILLVSWAESRRWFTLYIVTTWNVRVRRGIFSRTTVRVFYDEITDVHCSGPPDERRVGMGDVEIYSGGDNAKPTLVFDGVHNPDGIKEMILRFIMTIPDPPSWAHLDRP
ncbi:MAG: PH domain-containing protein [Candidatus Thorarchaeota archaeon]|jgi:membrane protein YdbS with pleckstrin-like domain